jgi:hypothetical protein
MSIFSFQEWNAKGKELYGEDNKKWEFRCPSCKKIQSFESLKEQMKKGIASQRYGILKSGDNVNIECSCYQPDCNWVANGLFCSGFLIIVDITKPFCKRLLENCTYVFPFAKLTDEEMEKMDNPKWKELMQE